MSPCYPLISVVTENSASQGTQPRELTKKKNHVNKNQRWEPIHQKYKANENTSRHNPKKEKTNNSEE
jgi:hypothetical protein